MNPTVQLMKTARVTAIDNDPVISARLAPLTDGTEQSLKEDYVCLRRTVGCAPTTLMRTLSVILSVPIRVAEIGS